VASRYRFVVCVALALSGYVSARAETIAFELDNQCRASAGALICEHAIAQRGDATAEHVSVTTEVDSREVRFDLGSFDPGESRDVETRFDIGDLRPGFHGVRTTLRYRDHDGYPFSVVVFSTLALDGLLPPTPATLAIDARPIVLNRLTEDLRVRIYNASSNSESVRVSLFLPDEVVSATEPVNVVVPPGESVEVPFRIRNAGAIAPSRYSGFAIAELESSNQQFLAFDEFALAVAVPKGLTQRHRGAVVTLLGLLLVLGLTNLRGGFSSAHVWLLGAAPVVLGVAIQAYLLDYLRLDLLLLETVTTGGDTASHYWAAHYLRHELLPSGRLLGWMAGNLAGFPIFQLYFPLPFLLMMVLSLGMPLTIAFKWGTVAGTLGLPVCAYFGLRMLGFERPVPAIASVSTLPFLFQEANSVWGGNLLSTLAGEFTYSFGLALVVLFVGFASRTLRRRKGWITSAMLLAAIGLSHAYALVFSAVWFVLVSVWSERPAKTLVRILLTGGFAFAMIGFWILPLLGYAKYTSPYADLWPVEGWGQLFPPLLWPAVAIAGFVVSAWLKDAVTGKAVDARLGSLVTGVAAAFVLNSVAHRLGVVDIRFLPFIQLFVGLLAAVGVGRSIRYFRNPLLEGLAPIVLLIAVAAAIDRTADRVPEWVHWNYSGFENRPGWEDFRSVNEAIRGDLNDPRVVFEHTPHHNAAGSIRAFESLPYFSGRSTLEGLYIQSSLVTPEIFYLQSTISSSASCPLPDFHCTAFNPSRAADHLRMFNVSEVIARTERVKAGLRNSPDFTWRLSRGPYDVFGVEGGSGEYVVPLGLEPIEVDAEDWRKTAFRWFGRAKEGTPIFVQSDLGETVTTDLRTVDRLLERPSHEIPEAEAVRVESSMSNHSIRITTSRPGHPLLIKVAFHPRWQSTTGETIHLATPGFMLVYPRSRELVLEFGETSISLAGKILTASSVLGLLLIPLVTRFRVDRREAQGDQVAPRHASYALLSLVLTVVIVRPVLRGDFAPSLFDEGMVYFRAANWEAAAGEYSRAITASPLSGAAVAARFYRGLSAYRQEDCAAVVRLFEAMRRDFPDSKYRAEAEYHIGLCHERLGNEVLAIRTHRSVTESHPQSTWADRAGRELRRLMDDPSS